MLGGTVNIGAVEHFVFGIYCEYSFIYIEWNLLKSNFDLITLWWEFLICCNDWVHYLNDDSIFSQKIADGMEHKKNVWKIVSLWNVMCICIIDMVAKRLDCMTVGINLLHIIDM